MLFLLNVFKPGKATIAKHMGNKGHRKKGTTQSSAIRRHVVVEKALVQVIWCSSFSMFHMFEANCFRLEGHAGCGALLS